MADEKKERGRLSDPQYQEKLRDIQRRRERQRDEDLRALMRHDWGRRLAYWLVFELGNLHAPSFAPDIKDGICAAMHASRNEGMRELAGEFLAQVRELSPDHFLAMMAEQIAARKADLAAEVAATPKGDTSE